MAFTAADVKALREKTGVGMMECKKALTEAEGDMDKAVEILRERGLATAAKKASRVAAEGVVAALTNDKCGALVELNCETDFVAGGPDFNELAKKVVKSVVDARPADIDALLKAPCAEDGTVEEAVQNVFFKLRENMKVRRFALIDGHVVSYIHAKGTVGVLVDFDTDDETAANADFIAMAKNVAMQIAAMNPEYLTEDDISAEELEKMKLITVESALNKPDSLPKPILTKVFAKAIADGVLSAEDVAAYEEQKNNKFLFNFLSKEGIAALATVAVAGKEEYAADPIFGKAIEGRVKKQIKETCLLQQAFVRSDVFEGDVKGYIASVAKAMGKAISLKAYVRFEKGEGIEKKEENFAEEIAKMVK